MQGFWVYNHHPSLTCVNSSWSVIGCHDAETGNTGRRERLQCNRSIYAWWDLVLRHGWTIGKSQRPMLNRVKPWYVAIICTSALLMYKLWPFTQATSIQRTLKDDALVYFVGTCIAEATLLFSVVYWGLSSFSNLGRSTKKGVLTRIRESSQLWHDGRKSDAVLRGMDRGKIMPLTEIAKQSQLSPEETLRILHILHAQDRVARIQIEALPGDIFWVKF